jgi:hypothetical protein
MNYYVLNQELINDPLVRGYSVMSDQEAADDLNIFNRTRNRSSMTGSEVLQSVDAAEYALLPDIKKNAFWGLLGIAVLDPFGVEADIILDIFGGGSNTVIALNADRIEDVSRAVELSLGFVLASDVLKARAIP